MKPLDGQFPRASCANRSGRRPGQAHGQGDSPAILAAEEPAQRLADRPAHQIPDRPFPRPRGAGGVASVSRVCNSSMSKTLRPANTRQQGVAAGGQFAQVATPAPDSPQPFQPRVGRQANQQRADRLRHPRAADLDEMEFQVADFHSGPSPPGIAQGLGQDGKRTCSSAHRSRSRPWRRIAPAAARRIPAPRFPGAGPGRDQHRLVAAETSRRSMSAGPVDQVRTARRWRGPFRPAAGYWNCSGCRRPAPRRPRRPAARTASCRFCVA